MLLKRFDFENKNVKEKFYFDIKDHIPTWEHYYDCYNYTLVKIFEKGLKKNYELNCRARGILFLVRQSLEICLKLNLEFNSFSIPVSHDFKDLLQDLENNKLVPFGFKELIDEINYDEDGTCYKYYWNKKTGKPFFTDGMQINLADFLKGYNELQNSENFIKGFICEPFEYNKKNIWDLTFHMTESKGLGQIRTQYDGVIEFLVEGILYEDYNINKIYIPLLFLIRHSLEIALKFNIEEARKYSINVSDKNLNDIHSLQKLYSLIGGYDGYLSKLDIDKMPFKMKKQYDKYKLNYEELNEIIHQLDKNSRYFRFPVDSKGNYHSINMKKDDIYKVLKLYYFTDTFITFLNAVLVEYGIINPFHI